MPNPLASPSFLVHPHQIEIQEFDWYALVIDARSAAAYREDRLPGAVNIPAARAGMSQAQHSTTGLPKALAPHASRLIPGDTVLVYCAEAAWTAWSGRRRCEQQACGSMCWVAAGATPALGGRRP